MDPFIRIEHPSTLTIDIPDLYSEMVLSPFHFFLASQENREMLVTISCIQSQRVLWVAMYRKKT